MTVDVYNANSAAARAVFARMRRDDILETQIQCTAVVDVPDEKDSGGWAFFEEEYQGAGRIRRPYMVVQGRVSELFIEEDDNRLFPCGAKRLVIKDFNQNKKAKDVLDYIPVRLNWRLSSDEISYLFSIGLAYDDFKPPVMLKGNKLEVPVNIVYKAGYESPVCAVDILEPDKIETSTKVNRYDTIFMNCEPSKQLLKEKENGGLDVEFNMSPDIPVMDFETEDVADVIEIPADNSMVVPSAEVDPVLPTEEEIEEDEIVADVEQKIHTMTDEYAEYKARQTANVSGILDEIRAEADKEDASSDGFYDSSKPARGTLRLSDRMALLQEKILKSDDNNSDTENKTTETEGIITDMTDYDKDDKTSVEVQHEKAESDADDQRERMRRLDRAMDNKALNEGNADTSGFGAVQVKSSDDEKLSAAESEHKDAEDEAEAQRERVRRIDNAMDNKALNAGSTNISGFGASDKNGLAQGLMDRIMKRKTEEAKRAAEFNTDTETGDKQDEAPGSRFL